jgi:putative transposase
MDFVADQLADSRRIGTLTIVDLFTRECLGIEVGFSLRAEDVVTALTHLKYDRGLPNRISCDSGSEFSGGMTDQWAYSNQVEIDFSRRGKPTDNAIVESFNGRFREECLNTHWFDSIDDVKEKIDHWRWNYNERRPHRSLKGLTPREFAVRTKQQGVADSKP